MFKNTEMIPKSELPYEKCQRRGVEFLSDAELLAVILRTGTAGKSVLELAQLILKQDEAGNLLALYRMSMEELQALPGIGRVKAVQLKCIGEISKRIAAASRRTQICLTDAHSVATYYMEKLRHEETEHLMICMFDSKCRLLGDAVISIGTVNASIVSPREIFLKALEYHAVHIILLHNHPSGLAQPSMADQNVTDKVSQCGSMLGIQLADHIIIGDNEYFSFKEQGRL